ncbi:hypothetical protein HMPREF0972_01504 [Actinomyces sp. oral taxon 848 str. F0332]|nr:hypothetical protein HMPREF0972_01504 [Actinomyces sp. oral taxon 848 str. F0332]
MPARFTPGVGPVGRLRQFTRRAQSRQGTCRSAALAVSNPSRFKTLGGSDREGGGRIRRG